MSISRLEQELEVLLGVKNNQQHELDTRLAPVPEIERRIGEAQRSMRENQSLLDAQFFSQVYCL